MFVKHSQGNLIYAITDHTSHYNTVSLVISIHGIYLPSMFMIFCSITCKHIWSAYVTWWIDSHFCLFFKCQWNGCFKKGFFGSMLVILILGICSTLLLMKLIISTWRSTLMGRVSRVYAIELSFHQVVYFGQITIRCLYSCLMTAKIHALHFYERINLVSCKQINICIKTFYYSLYFSNLWHHIDVQRKETFCV